MQKNKIRFLEFFFYKKNAKNKIRFHEFFFNKAKNEKLTRSHKIISQSNCSIMSFELDNKSWPRDNQPLRLLLMTEGRLLIDVGFLFSKTDTQSELIYGYFNEGLNPLLGDKI